MNKLFFRADAGKGIGYGHFVRTLAIANLVKEHYDCYFATQDPNDWQKDEISKVCKLIDLPSDASKFDLFLSMLSPHDIVFLDNYFNDFEYQKKIKEIGCKTVSMGDTYNRFCCDAVIGYVDNPALFNVDDARTLHLGFDWIVLREPFLNVRCKSTEDMITICYGGVDEALLAEQTVDILKNITDSRINVISNFDQARIKGLKDKGAEVFSKINAADIAHLYANSRIVITSASISALEAVSLRSKLIVGYYVDNQTHLYADIIRQNLAIGIGDLNHDLAQNLHLALSEITDFIPARFDFNNARDNYINLFNKI